MAGPSNILTTLAGRLISFYRNPQSPKTPAAIQAQAELVRKTYDDWYNGVAALGKDINDLRNLPPNSIIVTPSIPTGDFQVITDGTSGQVLTSNYPALPTFQTVGVGAQSYAHTQAVPSITWTISHNLGFYPNVTVFDSTERSIITEIEHVDINNLIVHNNAAFSGKAYCS